MKPPHHRPPPDPASGDDPDSPALEAWLSARRLRQPPAEWREAILRQAVAGAVARASTATSHPPVNGRVPVPGILRERTPFATWLQRLFAPLSSGWSLTAAAWVIALALNQYSLPSGAFKPATPPPPFSDAALAEIRESQRALGDLANVSSLSPALFSSPNPRQAPSESSLPASPILPPGDRPRARLPRGLREWHLAELDALAHSEPDLHS